MKKFFGLILLILIMISSNCFAMTFSQPIKMGHIGTGIQSPYLGLFVEGASENDGHLVTKKYSRKDGIYDPSNIAPHYDSGVARFGDGIEALYCRYSYDPYKIEFGGKNQYIINYPEAYVDIFKITSDEGLVLYALIYGYKYSSFIIIGRQKDGTWFKYVDSSNIEKQYYAGSRGYWEKPHYLNNITCRNNLVIIPFNWLGKENINGEFRFKWDEAAQWFGIEQVVY